MHVRLFRRCKENEKRKKEKMRGVIMKGFYGGREARI